jgi:hypothetical protein
VRLLKEDERLNAEIDESFPDTSLSCSEASNSQKPGEIKGKKGKKESSNQPGLV